MERPDRVARARALLRCAWPHVLAALSLLLVAVVLYQPLVHTALDYEDGEWIRGSFPGYRSRVLQVVLMNKVLLPLFSHRVEAYYLFAVGLHLACAMMVYALILGLARDLRTTLPRASWPAWAGGYVGALAFLAYEADNLTFLSGLSYQLFCLFGLGALIFSARYLATRQLKYWLFGVGCATAGLLSHSYGLAVPLAIGALELTHRRARVSVGGRWDLTGRYGLHLLPAWFFLVQLTGNLTAQRITAGRLLSHLYDPTVIRAAALHLANYLEMTAAVFLRRSHAAPEGLKPPLTSIGIHWSEGRLVAASLFVLVLLLGCVALARRWRVGSVQVALLFWVLWSGLAFHQTLLIGYDEDQDWRFYHNAAGLCVLLGFVAAEFLAHLPGMRRRAVARAGAMLLALLATVALLGQPGPRDRLGRLLSGDLPFKNAYSWAPPEWCGALESVSAVELEELLASRQPLRCRDLSHMNLAGLDFSGRDLRGANLSGANLWRAALRGADLRGAGACFADLGQTSMQGADLRGANLTGAHLGQADLDRARIDGVVLVGAFLYNVTMGDLPSEQVQYNLMRKGWKEEAR